MAGCGGPDLPTGIYSFKYYPSTQECVRVRTVWEEGRLNSTKKPEDIGKSCQNLFSHQSDDGQGMGVLVAERIGAADAYVGYSAPNMVLILPVRRGSNGQRIVHRCGDLSEKISRTSYSQWKGNESDCGGGSTSILPEVIRLGLLRTSAQAHTP